MRSQRKTARANKFARIRQECPKRIKPGDPNVPDWHTGLPSKFAFANYDARQRDYTHESQGIEFCPWPKDRCEVPLGPAYKTPQWQRTVKV